MFEIFRSDLTKAAHLASVEVFRRNLKKLLLTAPVRDKIGNDAHCTMIWERYKFLARTWKKVERFTVYTTMRDIFYA